MFNDETSAKFISMPRGEVIFSTGNLAFPWGRK